MSLNCKELTMTDSNVLKDMITGYAAGVSGIAALSNFYADDGTPGGENKYGEFGSFVDDTLNDYNPDLMDTLLDKIKNDPGTIARCSNFIIAYGKQLQELIDTGECSGWHSHGVDFALTRLGTGASFCDRGYGDIGEVLSDAVGRGDVTVWVTPEEGPVANATDIHFEED